jgi:glycerol-3-phosphate dehydrogenase
LVAEKVVEKIFNKKRKENIEFEIKSEEKYGIFNVDWEFNQENETLDILKSKIKNESVVRLQDLIVRRTTIGDNPPVALKYAKDIAGLFDWDELRILREIEDLEQYYTKRGFGNFIKNKVM